MTQSAVPGEKVRVGCDYLRRRDLSSYLSSMVNDVKSVLEVSREESLAVFDEGTFLVRELPLARAILGLLSNSKKIVCHVRDQQGVAEPDTRQDEVPPLRGLKCSLVSHCHQDGSCQCHNIAEEALVLDEGVGSSRVD